MPSVGRRQGNVVVIELHVLDSDLTIGEWCPHCNLPSAVRLPFVGVEPSTLRIVMRAATFVCQDCGRHWNDEG